MRLYYTPRSHFARKVRILIDAFELDVELVNIQDVTQREPAAFGGNPLLTIPTFLDDENAIFDSDNIARHLTQRFDPKDQFGVLSQDLAINNFRAVCNGVMSIDVELVLAARSGLDTQKHVRFQKRNEALVHGLRWLEEHASCVSSSASYTGFQLVCMWDHLLLYDLTPLTYPKLEAVVTELSTLPYVTKSQPS